MAWCVSKERGHHGQFRRTHPAPGRSTFMEGNRDKASGTVHALTHRPFEHNRGAIASPLPISRRPRRGTTGKTADVFMPADHAISSAGFECVPNDDIFIYLAICR